METRVKLHGYFRSSATWRVRIALELKGVAVEQVPHDLRIGEQRDPDYLARNPQGLVPALEIEGAVLTQSLAIIDWLDETYPDPPLLPADPLLRAKVRAAALLIACEVHPLQNLGVLKRLRAAGLDEAAVGRWAIETIEVGLEAFATLIADQPGPYCFGARLTLADLLLIPQLGNARRFGASYDFPRLREIDAACQSLAVFQRAAPEAQPDTAS